LGHLGVSAKSNSSKTELYSIHIILGQQNNPRSKEMIKTISDHLPKEKQMSTRQQGSGTVIVANNMTEKEIHQLADLLQPHSFIMSLKDYVTS
jgi:hypothetical protein